MRKGSTLPVFHALTAPTLRPGRTPSRNRSASCASLTSTVDALGDVVAGELRNEHRRPAAERLVDVEEAVELGDDVVEGPSCSRSRAYVLPCMRSQIQATLRPGVTLDDRRQRVAHPVLAHAGDERQAPRFPCRGPSVGQGEHLGRPSRTPSFTPIGLRSLRISSTLSAVEGTGALADPDEVTADVVREARARVDPRQRVLVVEQQGLMLA